MAYKITALRKKILFLTPGGCKYYRSYDIGDFIYGQMLVFENDRLRYWFCAHDSFNSLDTFNRIFEPLNINGLDEALKIVGQAMDRNFTISQSIPLGIPVNGVFTPEELKPLELAMWSKTVGFLN